MTANQIIFYLISALVLGSGVLAVTTQKIFRSAIWLLFSLIGIAGMFFWMDMNFIAAVQIIVYVGGIVVLIIFSIFLTQQSGNQMAKPVRNRVLFSTLAVLFGFAFTFMLINQHRFSASSDKLVEPSISNIGMRMLGSGEQGYVLPFEVVSILLLAAMIGCIVIAIKSRPEEK
ncbi:MAG: NADH-quinone oxidoreductase subunit J [Bacteroidetes bacterium]|nr:NADH-quinone oxidoreductase subunit J [Bacteroidota bacterium]